MRMGWNRLLRGHLKGNMGLLHQDCEGDLDWDHDIRLVNDELISGAPG